MSGAFAPRSGRGGPDEWIERVRAASDIVEVIGQHVALRRAGRNWTGLCPFHKEKTPSFSVNAERQFFHCFGCKAGGDVFRFVQDFEKVGFVEAAEMLSRRAGIPVPERRADRGERGQRGRLIEALDAAATAYEQWLGDPTMGAAARAYLERRGIARETQKRFRLGLAPAGWDFLARKLGQAAGAEETLVQAGLAMRREGPRGGIYDRFRNRLMVPLVAPGGTVVGFGARALAAEDQPKYLNSPETAVYHKGAFLFALEQARRAVDPDGEVIVVEGYFDAIALHQAGLANTVATSGTALTAEQAKLLRRLAPRVLLTYDGDRAGQDAMMRSLGVLLAEGLEVRVMDLPEGDDPDTLVRRESREGWERLRQAAADPVEFVQRHVLRAGGAGDPRERALLAIVALAVELKEPVRRTLLLERASQVLGFPADVLRRASQLRGAGQSSEMPVRAAVVQQRRTEGYVERKLLHVLTHHPEGLPLAAERVGPDDFRDPVFAAVARWLWDGGEGLPPEDEAGILARELAATPLTGEDWRGEIVLSTQRLKERQLQERRRELARQVERVTDEQERAGILREIQEIAKSLRELGASPAPPATA